MKRNTFPSKLCINSFVLAIMMIGLSSSSFGQTAFRTGNSIMSVNKNVLIIERSTEKGFAEIEFTRGQQLQKEEFFKSSFNTRVRKTKKAGRKEAVREKLTEEKGRVYPYFKIEDREYKPSFLLLAAE